MGEKPRVHVKKGVRALEEKFPSESVGREGRKEKDLQSSEGLDTSTGSDYDFHKDVMTEKEPVSYTHLTLPTTSRV